MARRPRILISAGEASGDRLGAGLARALLARRPDLELIGMGGEQMAAAGVGLVQDAAEVAVVGIVEVLAHLPAIRRAKKRLEQFLEREPPDLLVPIDFPDFNLRLAAAAGRNGVPVVYFVSPQVWAWRRGRVRRIRELVRRMLVLFPFETAVYEEAGVPVSFVGHPLAEAAPQAPPREELLARTGLDADRRTVALLPGSRRGEVERLFPIMLAAAARLDRDRGGLQWLVPVAPGLEPKQLSEPLAASGLDRAIVHSGDFPAVLSLCETGVVAAGTASLEAAVSGLPMVVVYKMNLLTYALGRALVRVEHVALPNLVMGRRVVPELIQGECTDSRIASELASYLDEPGRAEAVRGELVRVRQRLGGPGTFDRAAEGILAELDSAPGRRPGSEGV
jgi:lipid-A-disaccharide synthase